MSTTADWERGPVFTLLKSGSVLTASRIRTLAVWLVFCATLGSGVVNLYSVMDDPLLPERARLLREVFPLEFLHLSRSLTLLSGFALVISSVNVYRRKRRAWKLVLGLAGLSVLFHLSKGLDYEEATCSLALAGILLATRRAFTVESSVPNFGLGFLRLGAAFLAALGYGVLGFWLLDPKEFGVNFTIGDSIRHTLLFLSLVGDPGVAPHTRYAAWFVDSLYLITVTAFSYSIFALFRPTVYRFRTHPREGAVAKALAQQYGRDTQDFFKLWPDKSFFFSPRQDCFLAYRVGGSFAVVLGDPVGREEAIEETIQLFVQMCRRNDWAFGFHQVLPDRLALYLGLGLRKLKIGDVAIVELARFSLEGKAGKEFRSKVRQLENSGVRTVRYDPPIAENVVHQIREVSDEWLRFPGRRERRFTLGMFDPHYVRSTTVFAAHDAGGRMLGFLNLIPSYKKGESTCDLMRRRAEAPNGIMDYLFAKLLLDLKQAGVDRFNMGMAPMSGFRESEEPTPEERAVHYFFQRLSFTFSYRGLRHFKAKFATRWEPRYTIYRNVFDLPKLALALSRVSEFEE